MDGLFNECKKKTEAIPQGKQANEEYLTFNREVALMKIFQWTKGVFRYGPKKSDPPIWATVLGLSKKKDNNSQFMDMRITHYQY